MRRILSALLIVLTIPVISGRAQQAPALDKLLTTAEASRFASTSTYDEVVKFMQAVDFPR